MCNILEFPIKAFVDHLSFAGERSTNDSIRPRIFLPTFQRDEVWKSKQICELWDSLMRGIPLPSLILSKVGTSANEIAAKSHGDNTDALDTQSEDFWLLDGQQRAVAILCGFPRGEKCQRLWLDLDWSSDDEKTHGRRFGFFLCTEARPWGDDKALDSRPGPEHVCKARKKIDETKPPLDGCFDFQIALTRTWPVSATAPIPFAPLLGWALASIPELFTIETLRQRIHDYFRFKCAKTTSAAQDNEKLAGLLKGLLRLKNTSINATVANIDVENLLTAFTRFNRNGTQVNEAELFFAGLKRAWPDSHRLVAKVARAAEVFHELDVLRAFTVLGSQTDKDKGERKKGLSETLLTPAFLQTLNREPGKTFHEKIQRYLESDKARQLLERTRDVLRYKPENDDDAGLPAVMLPRLRVRTWLPVLHWIEQSGKLPENGEASALTATEREAILRFVLADHFFADWQPSENALLRDLLDLVAKEAVENRPFPCIATTFERLQQQKKPGNDTAWLRVVRVPIGKNNSHPLPLPLSPYELEKRFELHCEHYGWPPRDDGEVWLRNRWQDLLMWSQRSALDEWFASFLGKIAVLGEAGRPWDYDHLVPKSFFYRAEYEKEDVRAALEQFHLKKETWEIVRHWRDFTGNYRIWPSGFNRADADAGVIRKLIETCDIKPSHEVLSNWWNDQYSKLAVGSYPLADASAVDLAAQKWSETPKSKKPWTKEELIAFMKAVRVREQGLYGVLLEFIGPGFAGSRLTYRFESPANAAGDTTDSSGLAEV